MSQRRYDPLYRGFSKIDEGVFIFGPRVAQAVVIWALTGGPEFVFWDGTSSLPFSYRRLKEDWPEAVVDAVVGVAPHQYGLVMFLELIRDEKGRASSTTGFDEVVKIVKNLNHQVYQELCVISLVHLRRPVGRENVVYEEGTFSA